MFGMVVVSLNSFWQGYLHQLATRTAIYSGISIVPSGCILAFDDKLIIWNIGVFHILLGRSRAMNGFLCGAVWAKKHKNEPHYWKVINGYFNIFRKFIIATGTIWTKCVCVCVWWASERARAREWAMQHQEITGNWFSALPCTRPTKSHMKLDQ